MNWITVQRQLWIAGVVWLAGWQPVVAKLEGASLAKQQQLLGSLSWDAATLDISDNRHSLRPKYEGFDQSSKQSTLHPAAGNGTQAQRTIIQITGVRIVPTEAGFELLFTTADGSLQTPMTSVMGNAFIADIPDAVLNLSDGGEFQSANPIAGIALVTVSNVSGDRVQVAITGSDAPPTATARTSRQGLQFSVVPGKGAIADVLETDGAPIRVIVTAEKAPEALQDVPISITAFTREELEDAQIDSFQDIAGNTPNFYFNSVNSGGSYFSYYSVRGLSNFNFVNRDAVGFYIDDVPYDYGGFLDLNLIDLERVEVLRGPQNTLYGRSSPAGVVNIISRPPTNSLEIRSAASYGNENDRSVQLSISDAVIPDQLSLRLAGRYTARDGFYENTFLNESVGEESTIAGRSQLLWTPSPEWTISFNANASADDDGAPVIVPIDSPNPFRIEQDFDGFYDSSNNTQALRVAYTGSDFRATSITARRYSFQESQLDADATAVDLFRRLATFKSTVWSQELRLQSPETANRFQWLLGTYYEANDFNVPESGLHFSSLAAQQLGLPAAGFDRTSYESDRDTYAVFGQIAYQPIPPLTLISGLRYEASTSRLNRQRIFEVDGRSAAIPSGRTFNNVDQNDAEILPRFAAEYRINPNVMVYGNIAKGYRPGGLNPTAESESVLEYGEETAWSYELGLKSSWLDNRLTANLALFTTQVNDYQVLLRSFDALSSDIVNADARINGVELELKATPLDGLELTAGFGYIDAEFTDYVNPFTNIRFDGERLPYAPEYTYNLAAQYRSPGGLFTRLELQGSGVTFFDDANQFQQDPFALVNARIGYEWNTGGVYLFATNVFNTEYITTVLTALGQDFASYGDRRIVGLQTRVNF